MILYNTTYSVAIETGPDWLRWMKTFQLPAVMATGLPTGHKIRRLLTELDNGGVTYSVQLDFSTLADYESYQQYHAHALQQRIQHRFGGQYVSFDTLLEEV
jgi:Domain of unknown function (DUF4286)